MKTQIRSLITSLVFLPLLLAALKAHAVSPPPDGGYPGFNTAEGDKALLSLTTGTANTAVGWFSLGTNTIGSLNTGVGAGTLLLNTSNNNTAVGAAALLFNSTGENNTAVGVTALLHNTGGSFNTATGFQALYSNTTGDFNTAIGLDALNLNTTGHENTSVGGSALHSNVDGNNNTAVGLLALGANNSGGSNTAVGWSALANNTTGLSNVVIGAASGGSITTASNVICIGANLDGENASNSCYIGQIFNATSASGSAVFVNAAGKLGTATSSRRFKEEIKPMEQASEALFALQPVSFRYKKEIDPRRASQLGLVAEDVEKVNPDLVVRDKEGKPYSVRYDQVNAMLLNEFLKEHRKVEKLEAAVADLAEQLQNVTARVEMNNSSAQVAAMDR